MEQLGPPGPPTPYQRYEAATVNAHLPGAWPESAVHTIAKGACNPDTSDIERVLIADQPQKTPADFVTLLSEVYLVSRYYCSDKDQHLNVLLMISRDWPNAAQILPDGT